MLYLEAFSFALVWFSTLCLTGKSFLTKFGWLNYRVITSWSYLRQRLNATLREFCTSRTVFSAHNQTHLLLKIKHTIQSDEGLYGVGTVFENLSANHLEKTNLSVIELKFDGKWGSHLILLFTSIGYSKTRTIATLHYLSAIVIVLELCTYIIMSIWEFSLHVVCTFSDHIIL